MRQQHRRRKASDPRRGQLEGKRQSVQPAAQSGDIARVAECEAKSGVRRLRPFEEGRNSRTVCNVASEATA